MQQEKYESSVIHFLGDGTPSKEKLKEDKDRLYNALEMLLNALKADQGLVKHFEEHAERVIKSVGKD